ncbi:MAG: DUF1836 domain-containing protein [Lachnospiraceae bacterium]|nr:DUF1836 domain-containing protein [Lachnospiraceae bacterium]
MNSRITGKDRKFIADLLNRLGTIDYIQPGDFPSIDLYMDQVTTFMDNHLVHCKRNEEDKILTKTMINNYAKNDLLPPPEKKKYTKDHLLFMVWIYYFKNLLSIGDVQMIMSPLADYYFGKKGDRNLEDVYSKVYELCKKNKNTYVRDLIKSYEIVHETFDEAAFSDDPAEHEFIIKFCYLCMLGYDMYMKKVAMEKIIDDMRTDLERMEEKAAKDAKAAARAAKREAKEAKEAKAAREAKAAAVRAEKEKNKE